MAIENMKELATLQSKNATLFSCLILDTKDVNYAVIVHKNDNKVEYTIMVEADDKKLNELNMLMVSVLYKLL